jgi:hypothetical protein
MIHRNATIAMLAIMSIAALAGVFTVQTVDAQLPSLSVGTGGVEAESEEFDLSVDTSIADVDLGTEEFFLSADPRSGIRIFPVE